MKQDLATMGLPPYFQRKVLDTTETWNTNTTMRNLTDLTADVEKAGASDLFYKIELVAVVENSAGGIKIDFDGGSCVCSVVELAGVATPLTDAASAPWGTRSSALATDMTFGAVNEYKKIRITGMIKVSTAGTLIPRAAQNASDASDCRMLAGATFVVTRIEPIQP